MNQLNFNTLSIDDVVVIVYKGELVGCTILSIFDNGHQRKGCNVKLPNGVILYRHMYNLYKM